MADKDDTIGDECNALRALFAKEMPNKWKDQVVRLNQLAIFTVDEWGRGFRAQTTRH